MSCPTDCPSCVCSIRSIKKSKVKCRLVQYAEKRNVKINQCPPPLKCIKDRCQSLYLCPRNKCCPRKVCTHKPTFSCNCK